MIELSRRRLLMDGLATIVLAGEVHYFRLARDDWADRLDKLQQIGCTCVASYIPWLFHELPDGSLDLTGETRPERDVGAFIDLCAQRGLHFLARPGPFVMAELKNEGIPYRVYRDHPEIIPVGWDARSSPSAAVDYLAPSFAAEVERWYAAVIPVLARRQYGVRPNGSSSTGSGNIIGVQLDNEIGMLSWVTNSPDLSDSAVADFGAWVRAEHPDDYAKRYPIDWAGPTAWKHAVRSPDESWAAALRLDLGQFSRYRFCQYVDRLAATAARHGLDSVPLMINVHGTEGGNGVPFGIGLSQLSHTYRGRVGFLSGSDHYLGDMSLDTTCDLHFVNAALTATNGADQPLTSLEFEAGTGDYHSGLDHFYDPATVDLKTRLFVAQGNRLINYYLLAGGINPPLDEPVGDGNDRISFTGERHGQAAPVGPLGERGLTFHGTSAACRAISTHARWLADMEEDRDDVGAGWWPDAFMTEYHHPGSDIMTGIVDDLTAYRGPGPGKSLWRSLLFAGYRFGAVDVQDPSSRLPRVLAMSSGTIMDDRLQQRLADHVRDGGGLLLSGRLPERDLLLRPCMVLADAFGLRAGDTAVATSRYYPSVRGCGAISDLPETRVNALTTLLGAPEPLLTDVAGNPCAAALDVGAGRAVVLTADLPARPTVYAKLVSWLGAPPGLALQTDVWGVVATTTSSPDGQRLLHIINPTGYLAHVTVGVDDPTSLLNSPLRVPPRTGWMLPLGLDLGAIGVPARIVSANSEIVSVDHESITFSPSLGEETIAWLEHDGLKRVVGPGPEPLRVSLMA